VFNLFGAQFLISQREYFSYLEAPCRFTACCKYGTKVTANCVATPDLYNKETRNVTSIHIKNSIWFFVYVSEKLHPFFLLRSLETSLSVFRHHRRLTMDEKLKKYYCQHRRIATFQVHIRDTCVFYSTSLCMIIIVGVTKNFVPVNQNLRWRWLRIVTRCVCWITPPPFGRSVSSCLHQILWIRLMTAFESCYHVLKHITDT
jgi:hypothetical protein